MFDKIDNMSDLADQLTFPPYDGLPDIELYMDQVLDFLSRSRTSMREDKLSSAMVNNYIKADILPRARGKKYSREHLVYLAVIIRLKQILSVKDTGALIKACKADKSDEEFFDGFRELVGQSFTDIVEMLKTSEDKAADLALRLAVQSYVYKIASEYFIDNLLYDDVRKKSTQDEKKHPQGATEQGEE